ncbi:N-6 DNA methylase [Chryseobacterium sp. C39-AII1]|uniref:class I SAM-dependent DNA methyltransferase n=1 Tax=Chryseobacterium sp. C39-AII1 TaxID=3080332 RepID=UPI003209369B
MLSQDIKNKVQSLWDRLWAGGLSNPIEAIDQISYLLFMKRLENFKANLEDQYKWSIYNEYLGNNLLNHVKEVVFNYIKNDLASSNDAYAIAMSDAVFKFKSPALLRDAMNYINDIYVLIDNEIKHKNNDFQDIQGDVYEHLLLQTNEAGKNGQFRTPRHIIYLMANLLDLDVDGKICDITSGSGGFLVGAYQYLLTKYSKRITNDEDGLPRGLDGENLSENQRKKLKEQTFFGFDIDQTMVRIGVMNLMMHGIEKPNIVYTDSLSEDYESIELLRMEKKKLDDIKSKSIQGLYKYILANPPFTGKVDSIRISQNLDRVYPPQFDKEENRKNITVQSELLFLERIIYMLEEGGRAAVIVPEGVLFNSGKSHKAIRKLLLTDCTLEGLISLPSGVFLPYTGVKTSILLFSKRKYRNKEDDLQSVKVWFYGMESDGYSLDNARKRTIDFPLKDTLEGWKNKKHEDQSNLELNHFEIPIEKIIENDFELNFNLYKEYLYKPQEFERKDALLEKLKEIEASISEQLKQLDKL